MMTEEEKEKIEQANEDLSRILNPNNKYKRAQKMILERINR